MTEGRDPAGPGPKSDPQTDLSDTEQGWYLYGLTRQSALTARMRERARDAPATGSWTGSGPLQAIDYRDLAAIVRPVPLSQFDREVIAARVDDVAWLEGVVRGHNEIIATIHRHQAVLPATFGSVYAQREDVRRALERSYDTLLDQLRHLEGTDEWAVHVYANREAVRRHLASTAPSVEQIRRDLQTATPGRAYFLQRKLDDEIDRATSDVLGNLAQTAYDRLAQHAVEAQVAAPGGSAGAGDVEVLHAAFLVSRAGGDTFSAELHALEESLDGVRCESSGPWAPYSFVALNQEDMR